MTLQEKTQEQTATLDPPECFARDANGNIIPPRASKKLRNTEDDPEIAYRGNPTWRKPLGITMLCVLIALLFWNYTIIPAWQHYQEQLQCGAGHVCMTSVEVSPGATRMFVSLIYHKQIMVYEMPDKDHADSHVFAGPVLYSGADPATITPAIDVVDVNGDGYKDIVIESPDFQGANPVLYNHDNNHFSWEE